MHPLQAIILGVVEGATEFLPVSSTGHLILASSLLHIPSSSFLSTFEIAIQCGAILAIVVLYWRMFLNIELLKKLIVAFLPTAVIGFTVYPFVKGYLLNNTNVVVASLFLGGIALIVFELLHKEKDSAVDLKDITYRQALAIGLFQAIAVIPGVSRSAATILGGLMVGVRRLAIVEFSFFLAVPTMGAATGLDLLKSYKDITASSLGVLFLGTVVAFVVALVALKFLISYIRRYTFIPFGIYRIIIAVLFFLFVIR